MGRLAALARHQLLHYCKHKSIKFVIIDDSRVIGVALLARCAVIVAALYSLFVHKDFMEVRHVC